MSGLGQDRLTHSERNESAFGLIATKSPATRDVETGRRAVIQASKPGARIMRWVSPARYMRIHAVVDRSGLPVRLALTTGEAHDNRLAAKLLSRLGSGSMRLADRGYDADWIRTLVRQRGAWANIPPKSKRKEALSFSPYLYRARNLVERFFDKIKHCRRVATRYDKLAPNYLAFIQLASIRFWLRFNESTT